MPLYLCLVMIRVIKIFIMKSSLEHSRLSPTSRNLISDIKKVKPTSYSQAVQNDSPTPIRPLKTAIGLCSRTKQSSSFLISINKKSKTLSGETPFHQIHLQNSENKSIYYPFYPSLKLPTEAYELQEPENLQTDEKLREFSANCIKSWVYSLINQSNPA